MKQNTQGVRPDEVAHQRLTWAFARARSLAPLPKSSSCVHLDPHSPDSDEACHELFIPSAALHADSMTTGSPAAAVGFDVFPVPNMQNRAINKSTMDTLGVCHYDTAVR